MDPICHTFAGAALAGTRLGERTWGAKFALVVAANLPDVDVLAIAWGQDASLAWRRGWTHGILAIVVAPLLLALTIRWWGRCRGETVATDWLLGLCYLGFLSHPLLDWLNTYGMRWWMPFDGTWFYGDALFIVDPWLWLVLGGAAFLSFSSGIRARILWAAAAALLTLPLVTFDAVPMSAQAVWLGGIALLAGVRWRVRLGPAATRTACTAALALTAIYILAMAGVRNHIHQQLVEATGKRPQEVFVGPLPARVLARDVVLQGPNAYRPGTYRLGSGLQMTEPIEIQSSDTRVLAALLAPCAQGLGNWLRYPFFDLEDTDDGGTRVQLLDARYTRRRVHRGFGAWTVTFDAEGRVVGCP